MNPTLPNRKSKNQTPSEIQCSISETSVRIARRVLQCSGKRSTPTLLPSKTWRSFVAFCLLAPTLGAQVLRADCVSPPAGLIAWWRAENNADDARGNHHGALANGVSFAPGLAGQAFSFKGVDDYVAVPDSASWDLGANDFTIEFWTKLDLLKKTMFLHQQSGTNRGGFEFDLQTSVSSSTLVFALDPNTAGIARTWPPATNTWYHLAVTRTAGTFRIYVNGQQLGTEQFDARAVADVSGPLRIGNYTESLYELDGLLDELAIYARALSAGELAAIFAAGSAGKCPPPSLTIFRTATNTAVVSWPSPSTDFGLQQNTNSVSSVNWSNVTTLPTDNGTNKFIIVNPPTGNRFYRLFKP
jgi:hypothetical protein